MKKLAALLLALSLLLSLGSFALAENDGPMSILWTKKVEILC